MVYAGTLTFNIQLNTSKAQVQAGDIFDVEVWATLDSASNCTAPPGSQSCVLGAYNMSVAFNNQVFSMADTPQQMSGTAGSYSYAPGRLNLMQGSVNVGQSLLAGGPVKLATITFSANTASPGSVISVMNAGGSTIGGGAVNWGLLNATARPFDAASSAPPPLSLPPPVIPGSGFIPFDPGASGTPEPATIGVALAGLTFLILLRRLRRRRLQDAIRTTILPTPSS